MAHIVFINLAHELLPGVHITHTQIHTLTLFKTSTKSKLKIPMRCSTHLSLKHIQNIGCTQQANACFSSLCCRDQKYIFRDAQWTGLTHNVLFKGTNNENMFDPPHFAMIPNDCIGNDDDVDGIWLNAQPQMLRLFTITGPPNGYCLRVDGHTSIPSSPTSNCNKRNTNIYTIIYMNVAH